MKKIATLAAAAALVTMVGAMPAQAEVDQSRTLATGNVLYAIDCEDSIGQLVTVDPITAIATEVFAGYDTNVRTDINCAAPSAGWVPGTNDVYWISWDDSGDTLEKMDLTTGESTFVGLMGEDTKALAAGPDGTIYVVYNAGTNGKLGSVNTATGAITEIGEFNGELTGSFQKNNNYAFAYNPADQKFYMENDTDKHLYEVNVTNAFLTDKGQNFDHYGIWGMAFDTAGTIFTTGDGNVETYTVDTWATGDVQATNHTVSGHVVLGSNTNWYSESNFITYPTGSGSSGKKKKTLANTGVDAASNMLEVGGATALLVAGAAAVATGRRRKNNG